MNQASKPSQETSPVARFGVNMEIVFAVVVSLVAIAAIVVSRKFPSTGLSTDIGSSRFPLIYSIALLVLCAILIVQNLLKKSGASTEAVALLHTPSAEVETPDYRKSFRGILASIFCLATMPYVGYALASAVYLSFLMWMLGMKHKVLNPLLTVAITAIIYFTFSRALNVPLPIGSFFE